MTADNSGIYSGSNAVETAEAGCWGECNCVSVVLLRLRVVVLRVLVTVILLSLIPEAKITITRPSSYGHVCQDHERRNIDL